jgi:TonB family protein
MPAFMRTHQAIQEITYLGPEPDRWRSPAEPELDAAQAPDHFIDLELANMVGTLPRERYQYIADLYAQAILHPKMAAQLRPERVGFQPYITEEVWERLKSAMRDYRQLKAKGEDTKPVEDAILFYAGWLGHYVGDGSQPLHTTIEYNGWVGPNPNGYTTGHTIHWQFESTFVNAAISASDVEPLMTPLQPIGDEWNVYMAYLRRTHTYVDRVYQLYKENGFEGTGTPESRHFTAERLAAGASMLRNLYVAAWVKSAEPVPEWHPKDNKEKQKTASSDPPPSGAPARETASSVSAINPIVNEPFRGKTWRLGNRLSKPILRSTPVSVVIGPPNGTPAFRGFTVFGLVIDSNGYPRNVRIIRPLGKGLDNRAEAIVKSYRFTPATYKGRSVAVKTTMAVECSIFADPKQSAASLGSGEHIYHRPFPLGMSLAILRYAPEPILSKQARKEDVSGIVVVSLVVDKKGTAKDVRLIRGLGPEFDQPALAAVRKYRFTPAMYHGVPVAAQVQMMVDIHPE